MEPKQIRIPEGQIIVGDHFGNGKVVPPFEHNYEALFLSETTQLTKEMANKSLHFKNMEGPVDLICSPHAFSDGQLCFVFNHDAHHILTLKEFNFRGTEIQLGYNDSAILISEGTIFNVLRYEASGTSEFDVFSGDHVTTDFTLSLIPNPKTSAQVWVDGLLLIPEKHYTIIDNILRIYEPPYIGDENIVVVYTAKNISDQKLPLSYLTGLGLVYQNPKEIHVSPGMARSEDNRNNIHITSDLSLRTDTTGVSGGLLPRDGDLTFGQWYHVFVGVYQSRYVGCFSKTYEKPEDWSAFRRIGSIYIDRFGEIEQFEQQGDNFFFRTKQVVLNSSNNLPTSLVPREIPYIPSGVSVRPILEVNLCDTDVNYFESCPLACTFSTVRLATTNKTTSASGFVNSGILSEFPTNTQGQLCYRFLKDTAVYANLNVIGYVDLRGATG